MKNVFATLALAGLLLPSAHAQTPWIAPPGAPTYTIAQTGEQAPSVVAPQSGVLWGILREGVVVRNSTRNYTHTIFRTQDDGQTWQQGLSVNYEISSSPTSSLIGASISDISAIDGQTAWIMRTNYVNNVGQTQLLRTTTGPNGFTPVSTPPLTSMVHFFTATTGVAFAATLVPNATTWTVYRTTDGGMNWTAVPNPPTFASNNIYRPIVNKQSNGNTLWLSTRLNNTPGSGGTLLRTTDAGLTWTAVADVEMTAFEGDKQHGIGFGLNGQALSSADGGTTWTPLGYTRAGNDQCLTAVAGMPSTYLSYSYRIPGASNLANGTVSISYDRGATWQILDSGILSGTFQQLISVAPGQMWASLRFGSYTTDQPALLRYTGTALPSKPQQRASAVTAYPNPTSGAVQLAGELPAGTTARVYDAAGRLSRQAQVSGAARALDLTGLPAGLYQLRLTSPAGQVRTGRVSKVQ